MDKRNRPPVLTHARHDPAHCLAHGLFRSLKRGERKRLKLDVTYTHGVDSIRFRGPEPLGADDLRVLQGLVAMAATQGDEGRGVLLGNGKTESEADRQLLNKLDLKGDATEKAAMVAKGSFRQLANELGYAGEGGSQFRTIRESIERLWAVSVIVERGGRRQGFRILSQYASSEEYEGGLLVVALNPRLAGAVMGERPYTRISMAEVRALQTDPARLMHQRLCGWIDPGKSGRVKLDTLCGYIWPGQASAEAMKKRRQTVRKALEELAAVGWKINEYSENKWHIWRPGPRRNVPQTPAEHSPNPGVTFPAKILKNPAITGAPGNRGSPIH